MAEGRTPCDAALAEKLSLYENIFEHIENALALFDRNGCLVSWNRRAKSLLGWPESFFAKQAPTIEEILRFEARFEDEAIGDIQQFVLSLMQRLARGEQFRYERLLPAGRVVEICWQPAGGDGTIVTASDITERRIADQRLQTVMEGFPGGICIFDDGDRMVLCNETLREASEPTAELANGKLPSLDEYVWCCATRGDYGNGPACDLVDERLAAIKKREPLRHEIGAPENAITEVNLLPVSGGGFIETHIDITAQRTHALQLELVLQSFPGGICMIDKKLNLVLCNEQFKELLEYPDTLFADGMPSLEQLYVHSARRGEFGDGNIDRLVADRLELARQFQPQEFECVRPDGTVLEVRGMPVAGGGFMTTYLDITERLRQQTNAIRMANYNPLSGLPNRSLYEDRLTMALAQAERGMNLAIHHFRLYGFAEISERIGKRKTGRIIKMIGDRLQDAKRDTDTVAHPSGHEFYAIQVDVEDREGAASFARRIMQKIREPIETGDRIYEIEACCGVVMVPEDGTFQVELQERLAAMVYRSSEYGPGKITFAGDFAPGAAF